MSPISDLKGKVALVTGAARGLGKQFSATLAEAGAKVVCADLDVSALEGTMAEFKDLRYEVTSVAGDVSSADDVTAMISAALSNYGRLDIAINNAGIVTPPSRFHEISTSDWNRLIGIDLTGVFFCMKEELRVMVAQQSGNIINIASVAGIRGVAPEHKPRANYVAAKHAVVGLTKQAALEYAGDHIRVNAIAPGWFGGTDISRERTQKPGNTQDLEAKRNRFVPLGRKGNLSELKGLTLFLASDASSYITGQILTVDGGVTAR
jgi:NAD(P)-dependent dehydrogenase (short-subunit alcohol dehydrogenase family)